jgi:hypothetical protein
VARPQREVAVDAQDDGERASPRVVRRPSALRPVRRGSASRRGWACGRRGRRPRTWAVRRPRRTRWSCRGGRRSCSQVAPPHVDADRCVGRYLEPRTSTATGDDVLVSAGQVRASRRRRARSRAAGRSLHRLGRVRRRAGRGRSPPRGHRWVPRTRPACSAAHRSSREPLGRCSPASSGVPRASSDRCSSSDPAGTCEAAGHGDDAGQELPDHRREGAARASVHASGFMNISRKNSFGPASRPGSRSSIS